MPQLNPWPWFMILTTSWTIMLLMLMPMILQARTLTPPASQVSHYSPTPWSWTWT
uniref:ATPase subunit 8 n=1 Tax=Crossobamon orientalis TaxID=401522 RepID=A0A7R7G228_9SAUR|nr:ATPase subunit 8 [Crossobamon orientalis]